MANSVTTPAVVISPILSAAVSVKKRLPLGPFVIPEWADGPLTLSSSFPLVPAHLLFRLQKHFHDGLLPG
jgi:hypothetical protein